MMTEDTFKRIRRDALAGEVKADDVLLLCEVVDKLRKALSEAHQTNGELRAQLAESKPMDYATAAQMVDEARTL